jgi:uncharacterized membrane protein
MNLQLFEILMQWLKVAEYNLKREKVELSLLTHPDYGTLSSITDTLTEFGIEHAAASIPFQHIESITEPYIAYIKQNHEEQFVLVYPLGSNSYKLLLDKNKSAVVTKAELEAIWTRTIVAIEKNEAKNKIGLTPYLSIAAFTTIAAILIGLFISRERNGFEILYFTLSLFGLAFAGLIVNHQLGYNNELATKFCTLNKNSSCESVLNSRAAKLTKHLGLSDIGIIYFSSQALIQLLTNGTSIYFAIKGVSILAVPFVFYSIYLQKIVIKKWCPLCLLLISVLSLQGISSLVQLPSISSFQFKESFIAILVVALVGILWFLLLPLLQNSKAYKTSSIALLSFKRNYHLLLPYLQKQPLLKTNFDFKVNSIGNPSANLKLTVITNPLCESCIETHNLLHKILETNTNISIDLVYYVPLNNNDPRTIIAAHFLRQTKLEVKAEMQKWYSNPYPKTYLSKIDTSLSAENYKLLEQHKFWCHANSIYATPTILINGKRFPTFYKPTDVQFFMEALLENADSIQVVGFSNKVLVDNT